MEIDGRNVTTGFICGSVEAYNTEHRSRSFTEDRLRDAVSNAFPGGEAIVCTSEIIEAIGHMSGDKYEKAYNRNLSYGMNPFNAADLAFEQTFDLP